MAAPGRARASASAMRATAAAEASQQAARRQMAAHSASLAAAGDEEDEVMAFERVAKAQLMADMAADDSVLVDSSADVSLAASANYGHATVPASAPSPTRTRFTDSVRRTVDAELESALASSNSAPRSRSLSASARSTSGGMPAEEAQKLVAVNDHLQAQLASQAEAIERLLLQAQKSAAAPAAPVNNYDHEAESEALFVERERVAELTQELHQQNDALHATQLERDAAARSLAAFKASGNSSQRELQNALDAAEHTVSVQAAEIRQLTSSMREATQRSNEAGDLAQALEAQSALVESLTQENKDLKRRAASALQTHAAAQAQWGVELAAAQAQSRNLTSELEAARVRLARQLEEHEQDRSKARAREEALEAQVSSLRSQVDALTQSAYALESRHSHELAQKQSELFAAKQAAQESESTATTVRAQIKTIREQASRARSAEESIDLTNSAASQALALQSQAHTYERRIDTLKEGYENELGRSARAADEVRSEGERRLEAAQHETRIIERNLKASLTAMREAEAKLQAALQLTEREKEQALKELDRERQDKEDKVHTLHTSEQTNAELQRAIAQTKAQTAEAQQQTASHHETEVREFQAQISDLRVHAAHAATKLEQEVAARATLNENYVALQRDVTELEAKTEAERRQMRTLLDNQKRHADELELTLQEERTLFDLELGEQRQHAAELDRRLANAASHTGELTRQLKSRDEQIRDQLIPEGAAKDTELARARKHLLEQERANAAMQGKLDQSEVLLGQLQQQWTESKRVATASLQAAERRVKELEQDLDRLYPELESIKNIEATLQDELTQLVEQRDVLRDEVRARDHALQQLEVINAESRSQIEAQKRQLQSMDALTASKAALAAEKAEVEAEVDSLQKSMGRLTDTLKELETDRANNAALRAQLEQDVADWEARLQQATQERQNLQQALDNEEAEHRAVRDQLAQVQGEAQESSRVFSEERSRWTLSHDGIDNELRASVQNLATERSSAQQMWKELEEARLELGEARAELEELSTDHVRLNEAHQTLLDDNNLSKRAVLKSEEAITEVEAQGQALQGSLDQTQQQLRDVQQELRVARQESLDLSANVRALEDKVQADAATAAAHNADMASVMAAFDEIRGKYVAFEARHDALVRQSADDLAAARMDTARLQGELENQAAQLAAAQASVRTLQQHNKSLLLQADDERAAAESSMFESMSRTKREEQHYRTLHEQERLDAEARLEETLARVRSVEEKLRTAKESERVLSAQLEDANRAHDLDVDQFHAMERRMGQLKEEHAQELANRAKHADQLATAAENQLEHSRQEMLNSERTTQAKVNTLRADLTRIQTSLQTIEAERDQAVRDADAERASKEAKTHSLQLAHQSNAELQRIVEQLKAQNLEAETRLMASYSDQSRELQGKVTAIRLELSKLTAANEDLEHERQHALQDAEDQRQAREVAEHAIQGEQRTIGDLQKTIAQVKMHATETEQQIRLAHETEVRSLHDQLSESRVRDSIAAANLEKEVSARKAMDKNYVALQNDLTALEAKWEDERRQLAKKYSSDLTHALREERAVFDSELDNAHAHAQEFERRLADAKREIGELVRQLESRDGQIRDQLIPEGAAKESELAQTRKHLLEQERANSDLQASLDEREAHIGQLRSQLLENKRNASNALQAAETQLDDLELDLARLRPELAAAKSTSLALQGELAAAHEATAIAEREGRGLKHSLQQSESVCAESRTQIEAQARQLAVLETTKAQLAEDKAAAEDEVLSLKGTVAQLTRDLSEEGVERANAYARHAQLERERSDWQHKHQLVTEQAQHEQELAQDQDQQKSQAIETLQRRLADRTREASSLRSELDVNEESISSLHTQLAEIKQIQAQTSHALTQLQTAHSELTGAKSAVESQLQRCEDALLRAQESEKQYDDEVRTLTNNLSTVTQRLSQEEQAGDEVRGQYTEIESRHEQLVRQRADDIARATMEAERLESELVTVRTQLEAAQSSVRNLQQQNATILAQADDAQATAERTAEDTLSRTKRDEEHQRKLLLQEREDSEARLDEALARARMLEEKLRGSLEQERVLTSQLDAATRQNELDAQAAQQAAQSIDSLEKQLDDTTRQISVLEADLEARSAAYSTLRSQLASTLDQLSTTQSDLHDSTNHASQQREQSSTQIQQLTNELRVTSQALSEAEAELLRLTNDLDAAHSELDSRADTIAQLQDALAQLTEQLSHTNSGLEHKQTSLETTHTELSSARSALAQSNAQIASLESATRISAAQMSTLTSQAQDAAASIAQLQATADMRQVKINSLQQLLDELTQQDKQTAQTLAQTKATLAEVAAAKAGLEAQLEQCELALQRSQESEIQYDAQVNQLERDLTSVNQQLNEEAQVADEMRAQSADLDARLEHAVRQRADEIARATIEQERLESDIAATRAQLSAAQASMRTLQAENSSLLDRLSEADSALKSAALASERRLTQQQEQYEIELADSARLTDEVRAEYEQRLESTQAKIAALLTEQSNLQDNVQELESEKAQAQRDADLKNREMEVQAQELQAALRAGDELQRTMTQVKQQASEMQRQLMSSHDEQARELHDQLADARVQQSMAANRIEKEVAARQQANDNFSDLQREISELEQKWEDERRQLHQQSEVQKKQERELKSQLDGTAHELDLAQDQARQAALSIQSLEKRLADRARDISALEAEMESRGQTIDTLEAQIAELTHTHNQLTEDHTQLQTAHADLNDAKAALEAQLQRCEEALKTAHESETQYEMEVQQLREEQADVTQRLQQESLASDDVRTQFKAFELMHDQVARARTEETARAEKLDSELGNLRAQLNSAHASMRTLNSHNSTQVEQLAESAAALQSQANASERRQAQQQEQYEAELASSAQHTDEVRAEFERRLESSQAKIAALRTEQSKLQDNVHELETEKLKSESLAQHANNNVQALERELADSEEKWEDERQQLHQLLESQNKHERDLTAQLDDVTHQLNLATDQARQSGQSVQSLEKRLNDRTRDVSELGSELDARHDAIESLQKQLSELTQTHLQATHALSTLKAAHTDLEDNKAALEDQLQRCEDALRASQESEKQYDGEVRHLTATNKDLTQRLSQDEQSGRQRADDIARRNMEVDRLESELVTVRTQLSAAQASMRTLQLQNTSLAAQTEDARSSAERTVEDTLSRTKRDEEHYRSLLAQERADSQVRLDEALARARALDEKLRNSKEQERSLTAQLEDITRQHDLLTDSTRQSSQSIASLEKRLAERARDLATLEADVDTRSESVTTLRSQLTTALDQLSSSRLQKEEAAAQQQQLTNELRVTSQALAETEAELLRLTNELDSARAELESHIEPLDSLPGLHQSLTELSALATQQSRELDSRADTIDQIREEVAQLTEQLSHTSSGLEHKQTSLETTHTELSTTRTALAAANAQVASLESAGRTSAAQLATLTAQAQEATASIAQLQTTAEMRQAKINSLQLLLDELTQQNTQTVQELSQTKAKHSEVNGAKAGLEAQLQRYEAQLQESHATQTEYSSLRSHLSTAHSDVRQLQSQLDLVTLQFQEAQAREIGFVAMEVKLTKKATELEASLAQQKAQHDVQWAERQAEMERILAQRTGENTTLQAAQSQWAVAESTLQQTSNKLAAELAAIKQQQLDDMFQTNRHSHDVISSERARAEAVSRELTGIKEKLALSQADVTKYMQRVSEVQKQLLAAEADKKSLKGDLATKTEENQRLRAFFKRNSTMTTDMDIPWLNIDIERSRIVAAFDAKIAKYRASSSSRDSFELVEVLKSYSIDQLMRLQSAVADDRAGLIKQIENLQHAFDNLLDQQRMLMAGQKPGGNTPTLKSLSDDREVAALRRQAQDWAAERKTLMAYRDDLIQQLKEFVDKQDALHAKIARRRAKDVTDRERRDRERQEAADATHQLQQQVARKEERIKNLTAQIDSLSVGAQHTHHQAQVQAQAQAQAHANAAAFNAANTRRPSTAQLGTTTTTNNGELRIESLENDNGLQTYRATGFGALAHRTHAPTDDFGNILAQYTATRDVLLQAHTVRLQSQAQQ